MTASSPTEADPDDLPEVSTLPAGAADLISPAPGPWRRVEAPVAVTDTAPVEDAGLPEAPPQVPLLVKVFGIAATGALMLLAAWLGLTLGGTPTPAETMSPVEDGLWEMDPPKVVGEWVQGSSNRADRITEDGPEVVRAEYSDGERRVTLLLSRPEPDAGAYLRNAGVEDVVTINNSWCGTQSDSGVPVCAKVADQTGIMLVGLADESRATLVRQLDVFHGAVASE